MSTTVTYSPRTQHVPQHETVHRSPSTWKRVFSLRSKGKGKARAEEFPPEHDSSSIENGRIYHRPQAVPDRKAEDLQSGQTTSTVWEVLSHPSDGHSIDQSVDSDETPPGERIPGVRRVERPSPLRQFHVANPDQSPHLPTSERRVPVSDSSTSSRLRDEPSVHGRGYRRRHETRFHDPPEDHGYSDEHHSYEYSPSRASHRREEDRRDRHDDRGYREDYTPREHSISHASHRNKARAVNDARNEDRYHENYKPYGHSASHDSRRKEARVVNDAPVEHGYRDDYNPYGRSFPRGSRPKEVHQSPRSRVLLNRSDAPQSPPGPIVLMVDDNADIEIGTDKEGLVPYAEYLEQHGYRRNQGGRSYCVIPPGTPVIFQDEDGNEISRVGDFTGRTLRHGLHTQGPLIIQDEHGREVFRSHVPDDRARSHQSHSQSSHSSDGSDDDHSDSTYRRDHAGPLRPLPLPKSVSDHRGPSRAGSPVVFLNAQGHALHSSSGSVRSEGSRSSRRSHDVPKVVVLDTGSDHRVPLKEPSLGSYHGSYSSNHRSRDSRTRQEPANFQTVHLH